MISVITSAPAAFELHFPGPSSFEVSHGTKKTPRELGEGTPTACPYIR